MVAHTFKTSTHEAEADRFLSSGPARTTQSIPVLKDKGGNGKKEVDRVGEMRRGSGEGGRERWLNKQISRVLPHPTPS